MKIFLTTTFVLIVLWSNAQCHENRYLEALYDSELLTDQVYQGAWGLSGLCLSETSVSYADYDLDIYQPAGDPLNQRPCIVFAHGGAFLGGSKEVNPVPAFCHRMAERGFVVASINYRKCFNPLSENSSIRAVYRAVQDMKSAVRYMKATSEEWGIDTSLVFAGGSSAGAIMAMQAAYLDETERVEDLPQTFLSGDLGCLDCSGSYQNVSSRPHAVLNLWGAVADTTWISAPNNVPVISFHGTADDVVYYDTDHPFSFPLFPELYGSSPIHVRLDQQGIINQLFTLENQPHEAWNDSLYFEMIVAEAAAFLYDHFLKPIAPEVESPTIACPGKTVNVFYESEDENTTHCLDIPGGEIVGYGDGFIEVMFTDTGSYAVNIWSRNQWGALSDTVQTFIEVVPPPVNFDIVFSADTLFAIPGYEYEWYLDAVSIPGADQPQWIATANGTYEVVVTDSNGCSTTSAPLLWITTNTQEVAQGINLFPNPVRGKFRIEGIESASAHLELCDMNGKVHWSERARLPAEFPVINISPGMYVLRVQTAQFNWNTKLIINP